MLLAEGGELGSPPGAGLAATAAAARRLGVEPFPACPLLMGRQGPRALGSFVQFVKAQFVTAVLRLSPDPLSWHCQSSPETSSSPSWMSTSQSLNGDLRLCAGEEVWLFPRVLIRKLPGSHFDLSFILLLGCVCAGLGLHRGSGELWWGGDYYSAILVAGGDGRKKGSTPQLMP